MFRLGRSSSHASKPHQLKADRIHMDLRHKNIDCFFCLHTCVHEPHDVNAATTNPHERQYTLGGQTERERQSQGLGREKTSEKRRATERERGGRESERQRRKG